LTVAADSIRHAKHTNMKLNHAIPSAILTLFILGCEKKYAATNSTEPAPKPLVGDFTEAILPEIRYKRITDKNGSSIQGGDTYPDESIGLDANFQHALAVQWAGIKSLDPIPGKGNDLFFRYKFISELYPDPESAQLRDADFEANFREQIKNDRDNTTKRFFPVTHFSHDRIFYLLATDMSASIDKNEAGKLKMALIKHLNEK
jgi:hypothetical protein